MNENFKSGFVGVIGVPNAGKSSLVNALVKESVSIVTSKPQTTRKRTLGVLTEDDKFQIVFVDTPGVIEGDKGLNLFLKRELESCFKDIDVLVCALAPWEFDSAVKPWALQAAEKISGKNVIFIATQSDKTKRTREEILNCWTTWRPEGGTLIFTSAKSGEGLDILREQIVQQLPVGPAYYDVDTYTPQSMRNMATEIIRKHCFEKLHQEIPYGLAVKIQEFEESPTMYKIVADIMVVRENHKGMVIGSGGKSLKAIGTSARFELERFFERKIFLKLHVVSKPWIGNRQLMEELGYGI